MRKWIAAEVAVVGLAVFGDAAIVQQDGQQQSSPETEG